MNAQTKQHDQYMIDNLKKQLLEMKERPLYYSGAEITSIEMEIVARENSLAQDKPFDEDLYFSHPFSRAA